MFQICIKFIMMIIALLSLSYVWNMVSGQFPDLPQLPSFEIVEKALPTTVTGRMTAAATAAGLAGGVTCGGKCAVAAAAIATAYVGVKSVCPTPDKGIALCSQGHNLIDLELWGTTCAGKCLTLGPVEMPPNRDISTTILTQDGTTVTVRVRPLFVPTKVNATDEYMFHLPDIQNTIHEAYIMNYDKVEESLAEVLLFNPLKKCLSSQTDIDWDAPTHTLEKILLPRLQTCLTNEDTYNVYYMKLSGFQVRKIISDS